MTTTTTRPASEKQQAFITRLLGEKDTTGTAYEGWEPNWEQATSKAASGVIDYLLTLPNRKERANAEGQTYEAGVYEQPLTGRLFRCYMGQQSGHLLVKEIIVDEDGVGYNYVGSAQRTFGSMIVRRLSLEEVGAMGKTFDHCLACGRRLDDPESVDRGIGPICAKNY